MRVVIGTVIIGLMLAALFCLVAPAYAVIFIGDGVEPPSFLDKEDFEGVGLPPDWTNILRTADYDNTTNTPPQGSKWVYLDDDNGGDRRPRWDFTGDYAEVYVAFYYKFDAVTIPGPSFTPSLRDSSNNSLVWLLVTNSATPDFSCEGDGMTSTVSTFTGADNTLVRVQFRVKAGSGANAECAIWATDGAVSWGTSTRSTDGDWTVNADKMDLFMADSVNDDLWFDNIIISDSFIPISEYP